MRFRPALAKVGDPSLKADLHHGQGHPADTPTFGQNNFDWVGAVQVAGYHH